MNVMAAHRHELHKRTRKDRHAGPRDNNNKIAFFMNFCALPYNCAVLRAFISRKDAIVPHKVIYFSLYKMLDSRNIYLESVLDPFT